MDQSVKLKLDQGEKISVKNSRGVRYEPCLSPILFNFYSEYLNVDAFEEVEDFKIGRQITRTLKYVDDLLLLGKEQSVLQGMTDAMERKQMWKN
jgi:hypothetical protein